MNFIKARIFAAVLFASLTATAIVGCGPRPENIPENATRREYPTYGKELPRNQGMAGAPAEVPGRPDSNSATAKPNRVMPSDSIERSHVPH